MPKEVDKPGGLGDEGSEPSRTNTRVRNTSSPHREISPQASPPRFVSVEELREAAEGLTNMALAHEMVVNQDFELKPGEEYPEGSLERRVKDIMHEVFWDRLEADLNKDPPSYEHAITLLAEIKEILLSLLLTGLTHDLLRSRIHEVLDLQLIQQQAENRALDLSKVVEFVVGMMGTLCAPARDQDIQALKDIKGIVPLLKAIYPVLEKMKIDMANFCLRSLRPHLLQMSGEYERMKFQEFLDKQPNTLDFTEKWLQDTVKSLQESGADGSGAAATSKPSPLLPRTVQNHAYLRLLRWNHGSDLFPETVQLDQLRFQEMQWDVERLVLVSSVLLVVYNTSGDAITGLPGLMDSLKTTIYTLLTDLHTASFSADEAMATVGERMCVDLSQRLSKHGFTPFSPDQQRVLKGQISAVARPDNTIHKLMDSRIQTYLLEFLESSPHKSAPAPPGGLAPVSKELEEVAVRFCRLVNFNKLVFSPFYQKILQAILGDGGSHDAGT